MIDDRFPSTESALYWERANLVAFLAAVFPQDTVLAWNDPEEPDYPVLYVPTPRGQLTWHIAPSDLGLFRHVEQVANDDPRAVWDGHSTEEKYLRLQRLVDDMYTRARLGAAY